MSGSSTSENSGRAPSRVASLSNVLVVSGSSVFRDLLKLILAPHSESVFLAGDRKQALHALVEHGAFDVLLAETLLPDGSGLHLIDDLKELVATSPAIILIGERGGDVDPHVADHKGATAYLTKPISFRQIAGALKARQSVDPRAPRRRPGGRVSLLAFEEGNGQPDDAEPQLLCYARDLSSTGAFLETEFPLPLGSKLALAIEIGHMRLRVGAQVVRVQEPRWGESTGIGVHFTDCSQLTRDAIHAYVSQGGPDTY